MSPAATLAAQLRELAARAAAHSSPIALSAVLAEGFAAIAEAIEEGTSAIEQAVAQVVSLNDQERSEFVRDFLAGVGAGAGFDPYPVPGVTADQVIDAGPRGIEIASALHGLNAEEFEQAVTNARAILFGQVAE